MIKPNVDHATATEGQGQPSMEWWPLLISWPFASLFAEFFKFQSDTYLFYGLLVGHSNYHVEMSLG